MTAKTSHGESNSSDESKPSNQKETPSSNNQDQQQNVTTSSKSGYYNFVIALVGPYGAGSSSLAKELDQQFNGYQRCKSVLIKVSALLKELNGIVGKTELGEPGQDSPEYRSAMQKIGTNLRKLDIDIVGRLIATEILGKGADIEKDRPDIDTIVFIVDSLKNEADLNVLKSIYNKELFLIFVNAAKNIRWERMEKFKSWKREDRYKFEEYDQLDNDEKGVGKAGQQVGKLSSLADYYVVNNQNLHELSHSAERFVELLFGCEKSQPSFHEFAMHAAFSAGNKSYCLSRQVGAAIFDSNRQLIGIGCNDVPTKGGGLYSIDSQYDNRCYITGDRKCINDTNKQERYNILSEEIAKELKITEKRQIEKLKRVISKSKFKESIEYCRAVHAEMEALISVSRNGYAPTKNSTIYVTTEPCHNCMKHLLCAGVKKVVYIEPYPKSLALEFHSDAIVLDDGKIGATDHLILSPYEGVAPKRYHEFFMMVSDRKDSDGCLLRRTKQEQASKPQLGNRKRYREKDGRIGDIIWYNEYENATKFNQFVNDYSKEEENGK